MAGAVVDRLVFGRAAVVQRAVTAMRIEPALDVVEGGPAQPGPRRPGSSVDELSLVGGQNALGHGIEASTMTAYCRTIGEAARAVDERQNVKSE
jgi:hypothetical protein